MLLKVDFNQENVVYQRKGRIILKCNYYAQFATLLSVVTTKGTTKEDFDKNDAVINKQLFVGQKGGLSLA